MSGIDGSQSSSFAALELLADPAKLQAKIDSLKAAEENAREQIALAGPASEILKIRADIDADREEAELALINAHAEAERLVAEASESARTIVAKANEQAAELNAQADEINGIAAGNLATSNVAAAAVEADNKKVAVRVEQLNGVEESLQQKADALEMRAQELAGEKEKLAEVRELINQVT